MPLLQWAQRASLVLLLALIPRLAIAAASPDNGTVATVPPGEQDLYLEVVINGTPSRLIAAFRQRNDGSLAIAPQEIEEIGVKPQKDAIGSDGLIELDRLIGVTYRLDTVAQVVRMEVANEGRTVRKINAAAARGGAADQQIADTSASGGVLNYTLFATTNTDVYNFWIFDDHERAASAGLDGWYFSPWGVFSQSGSLSTSTSQLYRSVRLDTRWSYADQESLVDYTAGDVISGGLAWTRPVRLGGLQARRNFGLRPDLVTMPMPTLGGSAAVPSTVEVYANNVRVFTKDVPTGPFEISNIPIITGPGTAQIVIHDNLGRDTIATVPFFASSTLLREGLVDFSVESGLPRNYYGTLSNDYADAPTASATLRYGWRDWLTLESHAEVTEGLINGGAGAVFPIGYLGVGWLAAAASKAGPLGGQLAGGLELAFGPFSFNARSQRVLGEYADVAAVAASERLGLPLVDQQPLQALDQIAVSLALPFDPSTLTLSYTNLGYEEDDYRVVGASLTRPLWGGSSLFASISSELAAENGFLLYAGLSVPLGPRITANGSISSNSGDVLGGLDVSRSESMEVGSYGWRVREREGTQPERFLAGSYRASATRLEARLQQLGGAVSANAQIDGAVTVADGGIFFSNRINDAFAIVDVGIPDTRVLYQNRPVGRTNAQGQLLVPNLNAYQQNAISIDPTNLPIDAEIPKTKEIVVPGARAGAIAKFGISTNAASALLSLTDAQGRVLPPGLRVRLVGSDDDFLLGYDGQVYVRQLAKFNTVSVELPQGGRCEGSFAFTPQAGEQPVIPVVCR